MPDPVLSYAQQPPKQVGGALSLDFVNTVTWRGDPAARGERLFAYAELLCWARHTGILSSAEESRLLAEAGRRPGAARAALRTAVQLREALARLFLGADAAVRDTDLRLLNRMLAAAPRAGVRREVGGYRWARVRAGDPLQAPLHAVLRDAADVLTSADVRKVRRCGDARCGWLFLDKSRTSRRRWCSMADCGNRAKVRRHYQRHLG